MFTSLRQHFRYYLAFLLTLLLAVGVRMQAAPLGPGAGAEAPATVGPAPVAAGRGVAAR